MIETTNNLEQLKEILAVNDDDTALKKIVRLFAIELINIKEEINKLKESSITNK